MVRTVFVKLFFSFLIAIGALYSLFPLQDRDFPSYIQAQVTTHHAQFDELARNAQKMVEDGTSSSFFIALRTQVDERNIALSSFFKNLNVVDVPSLRQQNSIILNHLLKKSHSRLKQGLDLKGGVGFTLELEENTNTQVAQSNVNKAIDILRSRIDALGIAEPIIRARGPNQIEVQIAGISLKENPEALQALKKPAKLEFRFLHPTKTGAEGVSPGYEVLALSSINKSTGQIQETPLLVKKIPALTGKAIKEAYVTMSPSGSYEISLRLTAEGATRFATITKNNIGLRLGIVLDGKLCSAPVINSEIPNGLAVINGDFSYREALDLVNVLNNPLECELTVQELYEIGPSLAHAAKRNAIYGALLGGVLVIFFMIAYYQTIGFVAVISVLLNVLLVLAIQTSVGAALTLPAIAGLVLTIGMGVDANILVFERMREELSHNKTLGTALEAGYNRAFSTILDANLTTLLTAAILIWLGTGPVKGFGVTLAIGIAVSMFCVLFISRSLLELIIQKKWVNRLLSFNLFKAHSYKFLSWSKPAFVLSWLMVIASVFFVYQKRNTLYGIDFAGGDEISLTSAQKIPLESIYKIAFEEKLGEVSPSYRSGFTGEQAGILKIQTGLNRGKVLLQALQKTYPQNDIRLIGETTIGGSVSSTLKKDAILAVGVALLGIMLYVAFRFEFSFGIGALVSTIHDVILSIGIFVMIGGQFTAPMIAALLMIIGYSINDTIVVFDRIREELQLQPFMSLKNIINVSISKTLSRTLLTSITTLLATLALCIFGSGQVYDFARVFLIGIFVGTFSSIFIASPVLYWWNKGDRKRMHPARANFLEPSIPPL